MDQACLPEQGSYSITPLPDLTTMDTIPRGMAAMSHKDDMFSVDADNIASFGEWGAAGRCQLLQEYAPFVGQFGRTNSNTNNRSYLFALT